MNSICRIAGLGVAVVALAACDDFLDRIPEAEITPQAYFAAEADLAAYVINLYPFTSVSPGSYGMSTFGADNGTDNQAATSQGSFWTPGNWTVPQSGGVWSFTDIRRINYFFDQVLPKYRAGEISGSDDNIRHYIGEAYTVRAYNYFSKLTAMGDCPIVTEALPDDRAVLVEASRREPRHRVARFVLQQLDSAAVFLLDNPPGGKNRVSKDVAHLLRSRVALYEGTWLKHHRGTAFVPGGPGWGGDAADAAGFDIDAEIRFFLAEAMRSAKVVGDKLVDNLVENTDAPEGFDANLVAQNPYYAMFCDPDMSAYSEVAMWRAYSESESVTHNIQMQLIRNGGGTGWTRGLVNSFLMRNGLPIYAADSGYDDVWETQGVKATLQGRDSRIWQFTKKDADVEFYTYAGEESLWDPTWIVKGADETKMVTGFAVKKGKYYSADMGSLHDKGVTGSIVFRGTEAMLNYMEASYELDGAIDATASAYWRALRARAKVDPDYPRTIAATDVRREAEGDFGAYSHGQLVDATLYNIRRERRNEFFGEGMRLDDLKRWRALDQVPASGDGYQVEGLRFWGSVYEAAMVDANGVGLLKVDVDGGTGNMSDRAISGDYIRPYQISRSNNSVFNGLHFTAAHYLYPIPQSAFRQTAAGDQTDLATSNIYQNPGWPRVAGQGPSAVD